MFNLLLRNFKIRPGAYVSRALLFFAILIEATMLTSELLTPKRRALESRLFYSTYLLYLKTVYKKKFILRRRNLSK